MSPEKQRIAIAKTCGWTDIRRQNLYAGDRDLWGTKRIGGEKHRLRLPDYPSDLNACHEMEEMLTHDQHIDYMEWLGLCDDDHWYKVWAYVHATPTERCEAFLRTLGLWEKEGNTTKSASPTSPTNEQADHETAEQKLAWLTEILVTKAHDPIFADYWLRLARRNLRLGLPLTTPEPELNPATEQCSAPTPTQPKP